MFFSFKMSHQYSHLGIPSTLRTIICACVCVFECVTFNKFKYQTVGKAFQNKGINSVLDVLSLIRFQPLFMSHR